MMGVRTFGVWLAGLVVLFACSSTEREFGQGAGAAGVGGDMSMGGEPPSPAGGRAGAAMGGNGCPTDVPQCGEPMPLGGAGEGGAPTTDLGGAAGAGGMPPMLEVLCGDGRVEAEERCDDGNSAASDGCSSECQIESGWTCDGSEPSQCASTCGDGVVVGAEALAGGCDDKNTEPTDGCGPTCKVEAGYVCGGAPSTCAQTCGDGKVDSGETCDDKNALAGDGCLSCAVELGFRCDNTTPPSQCDDVDECEEGTDDCGANAKCTNTVGSFSCKCNAGYEGNGVTCTNIDECATNADNCHAKAQCTDTAGSFTCACNKGYDGNGVTCTNIDECATNADNCHAKAQCTDTAGSFTCACNSGYDGDGVTCTEIDECALNTDGCDPNATCSNTPLGSYSCACKAGYSGDGKSCTAIPKPTITSFKAENLRACGGGSVMLTAVFANGTGSIDQGVGAVTSGQSVSSGAIAATKTFTLTVSNAGVPSATATVTVNVVANGKFVATTGAYTGYQNTQPVRLKDDRILIVGDSSSAKIYDPRTELFSDATLGQARFYPGIALLPDGRVLLAGGWGSGTQQTTAELYDPVLGSVTPTSGAPQQGRYASGAVPLGNGKYLLAAGLFVQPGGSIALKNIDLFNPSVGANGTFEANSVTLTTARWGGAIVPLSSNKVLYAGGCTGTSLPTCPSITKTAEIYDGSTGSGSFTATGDLQVARMFGASTPLANGKVLFVGGTDLNNSLSSGELFDPTLNGNKGLFSATQAMKAKRSRATATLLSNGKVLIAGGETGGASSILKSAELYDPENGTFTLTGDMSTDREGHNAVLLKNGMVLVMNGIANAAGGGTKVAPGAELYCP